MSQRIVVNSRIFARDAGSLSGELPIASLTRVLDLLVDTTGNLSYYVEGQLGHRNRPQMVLELGGVLSICCQRCLEGIEYSLKVRRVLEFVDDEEELTQEEIEDDSKDFLPAEDETDVVALIEEELILDLPSAPRHESCALPNSGQDTGNISPFAVLKGLAGKAHKT